MSKLIAPYKFKQHTAYVPHCLPCKNEILCNEINLIHAKL